MSLIPEVPTLVVPPSSDDLARCPKKPKTHEGEVCPDSNMEVSPVPPSLLAPDPDTVMDGVRLGAELPRSFADTLRQESPSTDQPHFYMGDDEEEKYPGVDELFNSQQLSGDSPLLRDLGWS